eukprot:TRINITY_DN4922_c0_g1_i1.p1 TRINITY_DN4922_c0_g1~~TRINITY_DN4922_c0_g1_i1.p1  ORF type:complete len:274 (-),score=56.87 TRINITY_DN4922_c0_g1_i1:452-1273(-)
MAPRYLKAAAALAATACVLLPAAEAQKKKGTIAMTCTAMGCYHKYNPTLECQCNTQCEKYNDCCEDYWRLCAEHEYSQSGRHNPDPSAPMPDHHKNTPGTQFTTGFIRNIKVGGVVNGRLVVGFQGMGRVTARQHMGSYDKMLKEFKAQPPKPKGPGQPLEPAKPGPNHVDQVKKWGHRSCWYAEFPVNAKELPAEFSIDGITTEHSGSRHHGKVKRPDVEAHVNVKIGKNGEVEFARNRNFEPATLHLNAHPIPIGEKYEDHPKPLDSKIEL